MTKRLPRLAPTFALAVAALLLTASHAMAQAQVQSQVNNTASAQNDPRLVPLIGAELYGNTNGISTGAVRYGAQTNYLPSEIRYAQERSGALPSELLMNQAAIGPLAPNGPASYIPQQSTLQRLNHVPAPQLYNPAYRTGQAVGGLNATPSPNAVPSPQFVPGAIGYTYAVRPQASVYSIPPQSVVSPTGKTAPQPAGQMKQMPFTAETIRFLAAQEAARQNAATTQPSQAGATTQPAQGQ